MNGSGEVVSPAELVEERFLARAERNIRAASTKAVEAIVKIGFELTLVKAKVGHGKYEAFLLRFGWSPDTALNYTRVFELAKSRNVSGFDGLTISPSSLYLIAKPSVPEAVRERVVAQAATPEGISHAETKRVVAEAKAAAAPAPKAEVWTDQVDRMVTPPAPAPAAPPPPFNSRESAGDSEARLRQDATHSLHEALDAAIVGMRNIPIFLREVLEREAWKHERIFAGGSRHPPVTFREYVHAHYPAGLGLNFETVRGFIDDPELLAQFDAECGVAAPLAEPQDEIACERQKGCGYTDCKTAGRCLYAKPAPVVVIPKYSDAQLAEQERRSDIEAAICQREGGCSWHGAGGCADAGRCREAPRQPKAERVEPKAASPRSTVH